VKEVPVLDAGLITGEILGKLYITLFLLIKTLKIQKTADDFFCLPVFICLRYRQNYQVSC
jgi:hypothetical protein